MLLKMIILLPRQARDKHRKSGDKSGVFLQLRERQEEQEHMEAPEPLMPEGMTEMREMMKFLYSK
jgi:hypothetical protein